MLVRQVVGNVWIYNKKDHGVRCPRAQIEEWQPKYYTAEVSHEMFTANMQSLILHIIYIGSQIMHIGSQPRNVYLKNGDISIWNYTYHM